MTALLIYLGVSYLLAGVAFSTLSLGDAECDGLWERAQWCFMMAAFILLWPFPVAAMLADLGLNG